MKLIKPISLGCAVLLAVSLAAISGSIIYQDNFSDGESWLVGSTESGSADFYYEDNAYYIDLQQRNKIAWVWKTIDLPSKFSMEADFVSEDGGSTGFGFIWGTEDGSKGYMYVADIDKDEVFIREVQNTVRIGETVGTDLNGVGELNDLRIEINGDSVTMFANGHEKGTIDVDSLNIKRIGFIARNVGFKHARIRIDNFVVRELD